MLTLSSSSCSSQSRQQIFRNHLLRERSRLPFPNYNPHKKSIERIVRLLRQKTSPPILLVGCPGCGKTTALRDVVLHSPESIEFHWVDFDMRNERFDMAKTLAKVAKLEQYKNAVVIVDFNDKEDLVDSNADNDDEADMVKRIPDELTAALLDLLSTAGLKVIVSTSSDCVDGFKHLMGVHSATSAKIEVVITLQSSVPPPEVDSMREILGGSGGWCVGDYVSLSEMARRAGREKERGMGEVDEYAVYSEAVRKYGGRPLRFQSGMVGEVVFPDLLEDLLEEGQKSLEGSERVKKSEKISEKSYCNFDSIYGCDDVIKSINRRVIGPWAMKIAGETNNITEINYISETKNFSSLVPPPSGFLIYGPSGTAKSQLAKVTASFLRLPTIIVRSTDVLSKWMGGSEELIRRVFRTAREISRSCGVGAAILFDDIDAITINRENGDDEDDEVGGRMLSTLLNEMDGVDSGGESGRIILIATTSKPLSTIDSALLRPGRFSVRISTERPNAPQLLEILTGIMLENEGPGYDHILQNVDLLADLARLMEQRNYSGSDVRSLLNDAVLECLSENPTKVLTIEILQNLV